MLLLKLANILEFIGEKTETLDVRSSLNRAKIKPWRNVSRFAFVSGSNARFVVGVIRAVQLLFRII